MFTYVMIFVFAITFILIGLYILTTYVLPRKIEEIARMIEAGQYKLAINKLNDILEKDDRNPYAHYLLAEAYRQDKNSQYAIVEYRQVLKLGRFDDRMREANIRTQLAKLYKDRKAMEEARKEYLILTKIDPGNFENYFELGVIFYNKGVMDKALNFIKKSSSINPKHDLSFYYLGQIHYRNGSYPDAKQMFINCIKIDPSNYKAHYFLGLVLRHQGDHEWAIKEFETAQKSDELKVKSFLAKGSCYMEKGQYPKAVIEFDKGIKFARKGSETSLNLRYFLAECQEKTRDIHAAIQNWEKIIEVNSQFRDVQEKLQSYSEFRQDDRIKDFLIAGLSKFEHTSRKIVKGMGYNVLDVEIISDTEIEMIAIESEGKWRNTRQSNRIIRIIRTTDTVHETLLRKLQEKMKPKNATRAVVITTGEFSPQATDFANTRPVELFGKADLVDMLKKI
ncbi:MAG: tetratricopeptide repeat protein [bacterium]|nr:tetratricopeptide repeat protein [bacterium]